MPAVVRRPRPPELGPAGLRTWREVTRTYELSPGELECLRQLCGVVDELAWMREQLLGEPLIVLGSTGQPVPNPLLGALDVHRRTLETLWRALSLPMPDEDQGRYRSPNQVAAAQERWRKQRRAEGG